MVFWRSWGIERIRFTSSRLHIRNSGVFRRVYFSCSVLVVKNMPDLGDSVTSHITLT